MAQYNFGQGAMGGITGAGTGFSMGGPVGAGIGGILGLLSGFGGGNTKDKLKQISTMTPGQQNILKQLQGMIGPQGNVGQGYGESIDYLRDLLDPSGEAYQKFAAPYMQEFEQQTIPGLAERFAGLGAMGGGLSSSGFGQSLSAAGGNLQNQLAQLKAALAGQASQQLMGQYNNLSGTVLGAKPFGYQQIQGSPGMGQSAFNAYAQSGFPGLGGLGKSVGNSFLDFYQNYMPIGNAPI